MQIDLLPTSLAFAGIPIPDNIQGKDIFTDDYNEREYTFAARNRCDETTEIILSVHTKKFHYIPSIIFFFSV